jgi:prepilin-type N-terminal cleavage/methylation domain-containing protein
MKKAFTLIELLMVIAIIAIISTLAVSKVGGVKESSARKVSLANQSAVERAISSYMVAGGRLNRLDSLMYAGNGGAPLMGTAAEGDFDFTTTCTPQGREGFYYGPSAEGTAAVEQMRQEQNSGLMGELTKVMCLYTLSKTQVDALVNQLGLRYVMAHTAYADALDRQYPSVHYPKNRPYGDGTVPNAANGLNPNSSAIIATQVTNGMAVAAINPMTDLGRTIYQAMGQEIMNTKNWNESYDEAEVRAEIALKGGPLIAFGLGDSCSAIGNANAGLESAPYATYAQKRFYSRYILLFRLRTVGEGSVSQVIPEFAGVIDCCGNTIRAAESMIRSM